MKPARSKVEMTVFAVEISRQCFKVSSESKLVYVELWKRGRRNLEDWYLSKQPRLLTLKAPES